MLGNLFEERNWLLPKDYLVAENKKEDTNIDTAKPPLKDELKTEEASHQPEGREMWLGTQLSLLQIPKERRGRPTATETLTKATSQKTRYLESY